MHTPFGAVVANIRNLAVRSERGSEGCVVHAGMQRKSWAVNVHTFFAEPCTESLELRVPKNTLLHF